MFVANIFALCAMMTSYWAVGGSMLTNIVDMFKFKSENHVPTRLISLACVALPPFILAYSGLVSFVDAIYLAGTFGGVIMSILPALMVNSARKTADMGAALEVRLVLCAVGPGAHHHALLCGSPLCGFGSGGDPALRLVKEGGKCNACHSQRQSDLQLQCGASLSI